MKKPRMLFFGIDGGMPSYIKQEVANGNLPGFARIIKDGVFFEDCMTVFPSISPTCWNSIYTGAVPAVHGGECENMHVKGTNPWECITSYHSSKIKAEKFWEAAAKKGYKTLVLDACSSGPAKTDNVTHYGSCGIANTPDKSIADSYISGRPQQFLNINTGEDGVKLDIFGTKANGAFFSKADVILPKAEIIGENTYQFEALKNSQFYDPNEIEDYNWVVITSADGVQVGADVESAKASRKIGVGEWTDVITRELMTNSGRTCLFHYRARLDSMDAEKGQYSIYIPAVKNLLKEVQREQDADEIMDIAEVHTAYAGTDGDTYHFDEDKYFEVQNFNLEWKKQVISRCMEKHDYDIIFDYASFTDTVNHYFRPNFEGFEDYENKVLSEDDPIVQRARAITLRNYKLVDKHLTWLLDNVAGEDTNVCIVSDHGSVGYKEAFYQQDALEKAGLTVYTDDAKYTTPKNVDWTKSKAYAVGTCHIFVNLEGREPCGIVKPEDYTTVVNEIIDALHTYGKSTEGASAIAFAVPGNQAGFVGLGGEYSGDVVFGVAGGSICGWVGGVHAQQIPSARNATGGDIRSICIMSGKNFKKGCALTRPIDLTDIAPTMCYASDLPLPKDATGGIIFQAFKDAD